MERKWLEQIPCVRDFLALDNDLDRFDYAADFALFSPGLPAEECTEESRITGCDSGLYFKLSFENDRVHLVVQSGSLFVKGLGAMLAEAVAAADPAALCNQPIGLADLLYSQSLIAPERHKGLSQLEEEILSFVSKCQ